MSEPIPEYGGCPWPVDPACLTEDWLALEPEVQERSLALASETLRRLTGYRVGECPIKVRPCVSGGCWSAFVPYQGYGPFTPGLNVAGQWVNGCRCGGNSCATSCEVNLPRPVGRVDEVKVDGVVLDESDYEIQNGHILVWIGGGDCPWPTTQDFSKPDTQEGTFSITYLNAYPVDSIGAHAAGLLAMEFSKACRGKTCSLPPTVTEVVRNGVSFVIAPGSFPGGFTGLRVVDAYISLWRNENSPLEPSRVWTPTSGMRSSR